MENMEKIVGNVNMQVDNIVVFDLDESKDRKETLSEKRTRSTMRKLKETIEEQIKEDVKGVSGKNKENKEEMALETN